MVVKQNKYVDEKELAEILASWAEEYPDYITLECVGKSFEGRPMWGVTITDKKEGLPEHKPAMYIGACIHAGEIAGTQVCLYFMNYILQNIGKDKGVDRILKKRTIYIMPRNNPDGAEHFIHSEFEAWGNLRPFLLDKEVQGLDRADVDNNGLLLLMRKKDKNGEWKISKKDDRLMIPRLPYEFDEEYYSIYPEGVLVGDQVDADDFKVLPKKYQLNMNRNYPDGWNIQTSVSEGGTYPFSEPETEAVGKFIMSHPNIGTLNDMHTYAGVLLRPYSYRDDGTISDLDLEIYKQFGEMAKEETNYDLVGVYEAFSTPNSPARRGCLDDWTYENYGILSLTTELWDLSGVAGIPKEEGNYYPDQLKTEEEELKMLEWNDKELEGKNFINWKSFKHEQLGEVEIGGWNWKFTCKNPPIKYLEQECHKVSMMLLKQVNYLPELEIKTVKVEKLAKAIYKLDVVIENAGFLPTYLMEKALENKVAEDVKMELKSESPIKLIKGRALQVLGHLEGRIRLDRGFYFGQPAEGVPHKTATGSWILETSGEITEATIEVISNKGGNLTTKVVLD